MKPNTSVVRPRSRWGLSEIATHQHDHWRIVRSSSKQVMAGEEKTGEAGQGDYLIFAD